MASELSQRSLERLAEIEKEAPIPSTEASRKPPKEGRTTFRQERDGNKVLLFVTRDDGAEVWERIPLQVADHWPQEKQEWYLRGVAVRLHRKLSKVKMRKPRNGETPDLKGTRDIEATCDPSGPAA